MGKLTILDIDSLGSDYIPKKLSWWQDIMLDFKVTFEKIEIFFRDCAYGITNIFHFLPFVWRYRHWDYEYLLEFFIAVLRKHKAGIKRDNYVVETDEIVHQINTVIDDINRYRNHLEIYEDTHQDLLRQILEEEDEYKKEQLKTEFYLGVCDFEDESWDAIFDNMKEYMFKWWN